MRVSALCLLLSGCVVDYVVTDVPPEVPEADTGAAEPTEPPASEQPAAEEPAGEEPLPEEPPVEEPPVEEPPVEEAPATPPAPPDDCDVTSELIYLLDQDASTLYLFDPSSFGVQRLGEIDCSMWGEPESMAIARAGYALVRYSDDEVYEVDLATLRCSSTGYRPGRTGFGSFGMGFATDAAGVWMEQLYVANDHDLATLDTSTWRMTTFGRLPSQAELTGTSAGELWAFLPLERPAELRQVDRVTGRTLDTTPLPGFPNPIDIDMFAFAAWGGEHWLFVRTYGMGESTDIYRVDSRGRMTLELEDIGVNVVGAGVSTCAPI